MAGQHHPAPPCHIFDTSQPLNPAPNREPGYKRPSISSGGGMAISLGVGMTLLRWHKLRETFERLPTPLNVPDGDTNIRCAHSLCA
jgi:hypothetical protein